MSELLVKLDVVATTDAHTIRHSFWSWYTDDGQGEALSDDFVIRLVAECGSVVLLRGGSVTVERPPGG